MPRSPCLVASRRPWWHRASGTGLHARPSCGLKYVQLQPGGRREVPAVVRTTGECAALAALTASLARQAST
eukprot:10386243-Alexandrium_andersonii.AAC.1